MGKKNHHGGIKGTKFKFNSRGLDVVFPNITDHYFPQELLTYTEEGKIYVLYIIMFESY
ncbi:hypothetical protein MtrunA17_Chr5g0404001 [Medicago truncatula]|uniref:Uncharacterized protein n=1 Tax=Medicago truncatula TaxID=3880 RepID=A0A396HNP0_MEDTR|nr:hypothetical protein MtrunA17_Chr5g0404001 [Medicago truncatula]